MNNLFDFDKQNKTKSFLIGTDEAGRGPLAGPVVSAAVCFKEITPAIINELSKLNDSKKLTDSQRKTLFEIIKKYSIHSIVTIDVEEIEKINILQAALKAMKIACENVNKELPEEAEIFVDGKIKIPKLLLTQRTIVKGDATSASIAAASILAKVHRDNLMDEYAKEYPNYFWEKNKGYGTQKHIEAIKNFGITKLHRKSFLSKILQKEAPIQEKIKFD